MSVHSLPRWSTFCGAAAAREHVRDGHLKEQLDERARDGEVLLDLAVGDPGR
jgi:hypothetical protein